MRVSVLQENLAKGLNIVNRAVETRPSLPVLANVLLETEDSRLKLAATNLEMSIVCFIGAKVEQEGAITLPAKTFNDLVSNLSPERVDMALNVPTLTMNLKCGTSNANIKGIDASEFPLVRSGGMGDVQIPARVFQEMINQTVYAAAKDDNRPILTGVFMRIEGARISLSAADGYRLAVRNGELDSPVGKTVEMTIPAKALSEVARIISDDDDTVGITLPQSGEREVVMFHLRNVDVSTQLLEGKFPDLSAVIPKSYITATTVYTTDLLRACKRAEIFARDNANSAKLFVSPASGPGAPGEVKIIGRSNERGDNEGMIDASKAKRWTSRSTSNT
jgi:DNA polymerase III subunit beta